MKIKLIVVTILFLNFSCKDEKKEFQVIEFNNNYKFSKEIESELEKDTTDWKYQISSSDYAARGDYKNALKHWDLGYNNKPKRLLKEQLDSIKLAYKITPAIDYIIELSKINNVVIINEAHHNSSHRAFTKTLLQELYNNGYKNFGIEALGNGVKLDTLLNQRGYPLQETGYYIKDPQFGDLVREALSIGYTLFAYETTNKEGGKPREIEQAKNIQKMIEKKPNEKFIIHCGFAHVLEGEFPFWEKTMAGRLTEYMNIDPLTINQTYYSEKSKPELNPPLLKFLNIKRPTVLLDKNNNPLKYERDDSWADIAVFHPKTTYINDRPNWIFNYKNKNTQIDIDGIDLSFPVMILAFKKGEPIINGIPVDIYEVKDKSIMPHLALKPGVYEIVITNQEKEARKFELEVKN